jgi:hypothetical protein
MSDETNLQAEGLSPEPTPDAALPRPASPARERTLRHMRRLLAKAALAGAALESAGCIPIVCDPLPPPVTCDDGVTNDELAFAAFSQAHWVQGPSGLMIEVRIWLESYNLSFTGTPSVESATLDSFAMQKSELTLFCTPTSGATTVRASIPLKCDADTDAVLPLVLDVSGPSGVGFAVPVTIGE